MLVGADPDQVDAVARRLSRSAERIASMHGEVSRLVRASAWAGSDAERFEAAWRQRGRATLAGAAELLHTAAETLQRNAEDQRRTSEAGSGAIGGGGSGPGGGSGVGSSLGALDQAIELIFGPGYIWSRDVGATQAADLRDASSADQQAWWASLSAEQRQAMLAHQPLALLALAGLPADVRSSANRIAVQAIGRTVAVRSSEGEVYGEVTAFYVRVGADASARNVVFPDGSVEVTLALGGEVGGHVADGESEASLSLRGEATRTYRFASQAEADEFLRDLTGSLRPDTPGDWLRATVSPGSHVVHEVDEVFDDYSGHHRQTTVAGELTGNVTVDIPGVTEVEVDGGIGIERNLTNDTTTGYVELSGDADLRYGPWRYAGAADASIAVTWDDHNQLTELRVTGSYAATGGAGLDAGVYESSATVGAGGQFEARVDLRDPANRALAGELLRAQARGDVDATARAYSQLLDSSQVVVQSQAVARTEIEAGGTWGGFGVEAGYEGEARRAIETYVKPPHGEFGRV